jgi:hypothetical protein
MKTIQIQTDIELGNPETHPDCIHFGICRMTELDAPVSKKHDNCINTHAIVFCENQFIFIHFNTKMMNNCTIENHFAGDKFRVDMPYFLQKKYASALGLSNQKTWIIPAGTFNVKSQNDFLIVQFPLENTNQKQVRKLTTFSQT